MNWIFHLYIVFYYDAELILVVSNLQLHLTKKMYMNLYHWKSNDSLKGQLLSGIR